VRRGYGSTQGRAVLRAWIVVCLATAVPILGQPAGNAEYDLGKTVEIRGEVAMFGGVPGGDAYLVVVAPDENGANQQWNVSLGNARVMRTSGVNALTFMPGTQVVISGNPSASANDHRMLAQKVTRADGFVWMRPPPTP
jgi:hypothetical protein